MPGPQKELVSLVRCNRYQLTAVRQGMSELFEPWGGMGHFVRPGQKVLIKPNLLTGAPPEEAVTTHPLVIQVLAEMVQEAGAAVLIGDSPGNYPLEEIIAITGLDAVLRDTGAVLLPFTEAKPVRLHHPKEITVSLSRALDQVDLVINAGKLKTHTLTGLTGAVKNTYGCVVGKAKARLHFEYPNPLQFARLLLEIYLAVKPALSILDALVAMEGTGPRSGCPRRVGLLMAASNGIALDCVAAAVTGFAPSQVTTEAAARQRGCRGADLSEIEVRGVPLAEALIQDFDRGAASGGSIGALITRFPGSWLRNLQQRRRPFPRINPQKCTGCGICEHHCPAQVIGLQENRAVIERKRCIRCYCCQELCPHRAVDLFPR